MSAECVVGVYVGSMKAVAVRAKVEAGGNYRSVFASSRGVSSQHHRPAVFMRLQHPPTSPSHHTLTLLASVCWEIVVSSSLYLLYIFFVFERFVLLYFQRL